MGVESPEILLPAGSHPGKGHGVGLGVVSFMGHPEEKGLRWDFSSSKDFVATPSGKGTLEGLCLQNTKQKQRFPVGSERKVILGVLS